MPSSTRCCRRCRSWPFKGVPARPEAWLAVVARNRALDLLRHEARGLALAEELVPFGRARPPKAKATSTAS